MKKKKSSRFKNYERIETEKEGIITFGTTVFMRKDKKAIIIVFPAGQEMHFAPLD